MKTNLLQLICIFIILSSKIVIGQTLTHYVLYTGTDAGNKIILLHLQPNGQFVDPLIQYTMETGEQTNVILTSNYQFLLSGTGGIPSITRSYRINPDGTLITVSTFSIGGKHYIFPGNQLVYNGGTFLNLSTTGILSDAGYSYIPFPYQFNPTANIVLFFPGDYVLEMDSVNYSTGSSANFSMITSLVAGSTPYGIRYNPQGTMALVYGADAQPGGANGHVAVYTIQSTTISTTTQAFLDGTSAGGDMKITPDGKYAFVAGDHEINTLYINSSTTTVSDPTIVYTPPTINTSAGGGIFPLTITPDGKLITYQYFDNADGKLWLGSAFINNDGSLTWTGYKFPYGTTYANQAFDDQLISMAIYPVYITGIPEELWKDMDDK